MIDPLLRGGSDPSDQNAEDWRDDPWDQPTAVPRSRGFAADALPPAHGEWWPHLKRVVIIAVVVSLLFGAAGMWYLGQVNPAGGDTVATNFTVNDGDNLQTLSQRLKDEGFIGNAAIFRWYVERNGGLDITPGYYQVI